MRVFVFLLLSLLFIGCTAQQPSAPQPNASPPIKTVDLDNTTQQEPAPSGTGQPTAPSTPPATGTAPAPSYNLASKEVSFPSGAWKVYGTLYQSTSKTPTRVIVLVPGMGTTRDSYPQSFIKRLHDDMPDAMVLALDMRGTGKSTNLGTWDKFTTDDFKDMKTDIISAEKVFKDDYPTVKEYYAVGASIGSTAAILAAAQDRKIDKVVMLSPGMEYQGVSIDSALQGYATPLLAVASSGDAYSAQAVDSIGSLTSKEQTTKKIYPGISAHGTDMFDATQTYPDRLEAVVSNFLK
jgi:pimeloyl-ACP methyl ester carboxylesterase